MANLILNGSFDDGPANWSGTDIETTHSEGAYLGNGSNNSVSEIDGDNTQTTVMEQSFTVTAPTITELTFDTALRTAGDPGIDGFLVEIVDSDNNVIATQTYMPTNTASLQAAAPLSINFPAGGTYTLRFTEIGDNDSLGAIVDNIVIMDCFCANTKIRTQSGRVRAGDLQKGDMIWTKDHGFQEIRWIGKRKVELYEQLFDQSMIPIGFAKGSLGNGLPKRDLFLSPNHRVLQQGWKAQLLFGEDEILIPAKFLVNDINIRRIGPSTNLEYVHFLFDQHEIVEADGVLTESFLPTGLSLSGVEKDAQNEILKLFPELETCVQAPVNTARHVLNSFEAEVLTS